MGKSDVSAVQGHPCDFLLLSPWYSNLGHILHPFGDIAGFVILTNPYSTLLLGVFPLDQVAHVGVMPSISLKLISRVVIFEVFHFQPMWSLSTNVTDRRTTCNRKTSLCTIVHRAVKTT